MVCSLDVSLYNSLSQVNHPLVWHWKYYNIRIMDYNKKWNCYRIDHKKHSTKEISKKCDTRCRGNDFYKTAFLWPNRKELNSNSASNHFFIHHARDKLSPLNSRINRLRTNIQSPTNANSSLIVTRYFIKTNPSKMRTWTYLASFKKDCVIMSSWYIQTHILRIKK